MLKFDRQGLIPVVVQDDVSAEVLMVAFMNQEALELTQRTGFTHFYSRSRNTIWRKGEQSGNVQQVRAIFVNCEENSLLIRVVQHGGAACHEGYRSCYYRRLLPDESYETVAERVFDPTTVYESDVPIAARTFLIANNAALEEMQRTLEAQLRQLYRVYIYLRDNDLSAESNTSRLLQEHSLSYLLSRLADELQELADVQSGEHMHSGRQPDTMLEGSQVGYWLLLIASARKLVYDDFMPHASILSGYHAQYSEGKVVEMRQDCLSLLASDQRAGVVQGLHLGFAFIGWACAQAGISPLAPTEYDLEQMRHRGLIP
ncbi:MAG TPA: phosphoribosyl-AMP cyclohydrolase [Ktedonosporobacter sp.]|jgi:phosphoribosyl-AMP cyclohydrolase|nr:phosphoribosyl-AMP cyclohydrolase [Ktedonosporobacter sp.]